MAKQRERQSRLSNLSTEEIFRQKIALRQCLWGFFLEVKKGKALTQSDREHVFDEFEKNADFAEEAFSKVLEEKSSHSDLAAELRDEVMEIINARSLKGLKKLKSKFFVEGKYPDDQRRYLKKLYIKRKAKLKTQTE